MHHLNYNHLYYFWVVATEGSVTRAAELLFLTPQTISGQLRTLEETVEAKLFTKVGRRLALTEIGQVVFNYADSMFSLGTELTHLLKSGAPGRSLLFSVGVAMVVPKLITYRVLEPVLHLTEPVRMVCHEAPLENLLADLAIHKLDLVLADSPVSPALNVKAFNHFLGECGLTFFIARAQAARFAEDFPRSLHQAPMLVPTSRSALRRGLEQWFERERIEPQVVCEFEDSALMKAFGQAGVGIFSTPSAIENEVRQQYEVDVIGRIDSIRERFYAISPERRLRHPATVAVTDAARQNLFGGRVSEISS